jgi:hypothetical protein
MDKFDAGAPRVLEASGLDGVVLIRIFLLEQQLKSATREASISDYVSVSTALAQSPLALWAHPGKLDRSE